MQRSFATGIVAGLLVLVSGGCLNNSPVQRSDAAVGRDDAATDLTAILDSPADTTGVDTATCSGCANTCDVDGDGREHAGQGCRGDDCDDGHPNCWDEAAHGCCWGDGLIFHSEFEGGVEIEIPTTPASQWRLPFVGSDSVTGYDWSTEFPEAGTHVNVNTQVNGQSVLLGTDPARIDDPDGKQYGTTGFVDARVISHPGIDGQTNNRALFYHSWRDDPTMGSNSRLQANWIPPSSMSQLDGEIYIAYWLKLQPNLYQVHTEFADPDDWHSRWRNIGEWRHDQAGCSDASFRFVLGFETYNSKHVYWMLEAKGLWSQKTQTRPDLAPPVDKWFFLEVYTKRHPENGRVWVGANGMTIFDQKGIQTMPKTTGCWNGAFYYQFLKMYGDLYNYEDRITADRPPYQFWQYYDGLRIYNKLPAGHCAVTESCPLAKDLTPSPN